jgi:hypothetical protein
MEQWKNGNNFKLNNDVIGNNGKKGMASHGTNIPNDNNGRPKQYHHELKQNQ